MSFEMASKETPAGERESAHLMTARSGLAAACAEGIEVVP